MTLDLLTKMSRLTRRARLAEKFVGRDAVAGIIDGPAAKKANPDSLMVEFVATTEGIDIDSDVVVASGVDPKSYFFTNKSVFADHMYDLGSLVGKARRVIPRPSLEKVSQWDVHVRLIEDHPHAKLIAKLAADGLIGSSIGYAANEYGPPDDEELNRYSKGGRRPLRIIRSWEWVELSVTAIPANVEAQAIGYEPAKQALLDDLLTKGTIDRKLASALGFTGGTERSIYPTADSALAKRRLIVILSEDN